MDEATAEVPPATRCGFVALIGAPNVGKSTLVNALVGQKVAIVSPKAQTTRARLMGIAIEGDAQGCGARDTCGLCRADICQDGDAHTDITGRQGAEGADHKANRCWMIFEKEKQKENNDCDCADGDDLPVKICFRAFLHGCRDLSHFLIAGRAADDRDDQKKGKYQADDGT